MMKNSYSNYVRRVGRALNLPRRQKKELLLGFRSELEERFPEKASAQTLLNDVGTPEEVACTLLEAVDAKDCTRFNSVRLRRLKCLIIVLALLTALSAGAFLFFDMTQVNRAEVVIFEDPTPTLYTTSPDNES